MKKKYQKEFDEAKSVINDTLSKLEHEYKVNFITESNAVLTKFLDIMVKRDFSQEKGFIILFRWQSV